MIDRRLDIGDKIGLVGMSCVVIIMFAIFIVGIVTVNGWLVDFFHGGIE